MYNFGVEYTPSNVSLTHNPTTLTQLKNVGIKYIRIQWVDLANIVRYRVVPISYFEKLQKSQRPGVGVAKAGLGLVYMNMAQGFTAMGEFLYVPDIKTFRICPYAPGHASVMGWFQEKTPTPDPEGNLSVVSNICPRTLLDRIVKDAKSVSNVDFLVGFESEFILLTTTKPVQAVNYHNWTASEGLPSGKSETIVLEEIADGVQASGIELQMYHPEAAPGQYEIVLGPLPPLEAADALVHTREIIRNVASKHGLRATFAPRIYMTSAGTSNHTHISVHSPTASTESKPIDGLSPLESSFLAGVLEHLPSMPAVTLPIPASYKRVGDGVWSGGTYVCWGTENRESPIRLTNATSPTSRRFEMRFIDGTANPYLVLAIILAAGHEGIRTKQKLRMENCPGPMSAAQMEEEDRRKLGITNRLPLSWQEARVNLEKDELLGRLFGNNFVASYLAVNKTLGDSLEQDEVEEEKLARLVEFY